MCHFLAPVGQPEMMHKNFMRRHLRISVVRCSGMKFFAHFQLNTPQIKPLISLRIQRLFSFPKILQKLTQARLEKGLSQEQLAKRIGTQRSNICRIEKGTQNLSLDLMLKIAEALDKDVSVMLEERSSTMEKIYSLRLYDETLLILRSAVAGGLYRRGRRRMCDCSLCWHIRW